MVTVRERDPVILDQEPFVESNGSSQVQEEARLLVKALMTDIHADSGEDDLDPILSIENDDENCDTQNIEDVANLYYNQRIEEMENEHQKRKTMQDQEIVDLKQMLKEVQTTKRNRKTSYRKKMKKCEIAIGNKMAQIFICHFFPGEGDIGIALLQMKSQPHLFVTHLEKHGQAYKFEKLGPGLLLYEIVSSVPGNARGKRITAKSLVKLRATITNEMANNKIITIKFLVPFPNICLHEVKQRVIRPNVSKFGFKRISRPRSRMSRCLSRILF